jgi:5-methylcytosine-specific restriction endonuclease McrA
MRTCRTCGVEKALSEFYFHKRDGHIVHCKTCVNARQRTTYREDLRASRQKAARHTAIHRARYPDRFTKEARRAARLREYEKHRAVTIARSRQWRKDHPGASWQMVKNWMRKNSANRQRYLHGKVVKENRRRDRAGGPTRVRPADILEMLNAQQWLCAYCKCSLKETAYDLEHRVPISRGGLTVRGNLCMACRSCNRLKHTRTAEEFSAA